MFKNIIFWYYGYISKSRGVVVQSLLGTDIHKVILNILRKSFLNSETHKSRNIVTKESTINSAKAKLVMDGFKRETSNEGSSKNGIEANKCCYIRGEVRQRLLRRIWIDFTK